MKNLKISLINYKINIFLIWSRNCVISSNTSANQAAPFAITDVKLYVPGEILIIDNNAKLIHKNEIQDLNA